MVTSQRSFKGTERIGVKSTGSFLAQNLCVFHALWPHSSFGNWHNLWIFLSFLWVKGLRKGAPLLRQPSTPMQPHCWVSGRWLTPWQVMPGDFQCCFWHCPLTSQQGTPGWHSESFTWAEEPQVLRGAFMVLPNSMGEWIALPTVSLSIKKMAVHLTGQKSSSSEGKREEGPSMLSYCNVGVKLSFLLRNKKGVGGAIEKE